MGLRANGSSIIGRRYRASGYASTSMDPQRLGRLDPARYHVRQHGLALSLGTAMRLWHGLIGGVAPATRDHLEALRARFADLLRADLANVAAGAYPRELLFSFPAREYLARLPAALLEGARVLRRQRRRRHDELPDGVDRERYPSYYLRNFHWQTDGWLSERSARVYDGNVEALFGGTADVMRRMAIPAIAEALADRPRGRVLDVGCGTGRLLAQLHAALPAARLYGLDLSAPYLARARRVAGAAPDLSLVADNAEAMPFADGTFDAVASSFLFHELPRDARRRVARELVRVTAPGGTIAIVDSAQRRDGGPLEPFLGSFPRTYHEPYFKGYLDDPLEDLLAEAGFVDLEASPRFVSKLVTGRRP
jgi:ubiquinone/menaquinone biosynthesis C-methylase UbiE